MKLWIATFGNWGIDNNGIKWIGSENISFDISLTEIVKTGDHKNSAIYLWLVEVATSKQFSMCDIYCLNTAFVFTLDYFREELNIPEHALLAETLKNQAKVLESKEVNA